jgi:hypothetical protein
MIVAFYLPALFLYIKGQRNKPLIRIGRSPRRWRWQS